MKLIKYLFISFLVLSVIAFIVLSMTINTMVKNAIEQHGTRITGTVVSVDRVSISPFTGRGEVNGFKVTNPDGYRDPYAFTTDSFSLQISLRTLLSDEIIIHEVFIRNPSVFVEQKLPDNNLYIILRNIQIEAAIEESDKEMIIEYFNLSGATATLYTEIGVERTVTIDVEEIELRDIGRGGGREAAEEVVQKIAEEIVQTILQDAVRTGGGQLRDTIRGLFD